MTDPELTGTVGGRQQWLSSDYPCAPCLKRVCKERTDNREPPPCYQSLGPERVWENLETLLEESFG